jgi:hypothetical protein
MLFRKFTKWVPVLIYQSSLNCYLLQGRKNLKTGELYFKNKMLNKPFTDMRNMPTDFFNPMIQFDKIIFDKGEKEPNGK